MTEPLPSIYIAGSSAEVERVRYWTSAAERAGWEITLDWLRVMDTVAREDRLLADVDRQMHARDAWHAIHRADVYWLLAPEEPSIGAWTELGLAIAAGRVEVIASGPASRRSIFAALAEEFATDHSAFEAICTRYVRGER